LPFDILGNNPQADDLVEGLTEDLITALAKVRELFVTDRHSIEIYKGRSATVHDVANALSVRHVLTGSIRTIGDRMRCSVQLVDSVDGQHLWAERYDRQIDDIFALQDEIVWHILLELQVTLTEGESARIASRGTRNLEAWLLRVQGANELGKMTRQGIIRARELFEAALIADPKWARPLAAIAHCYFYDARFGWGLPREDSIALAIDYAEQAIAMDAEESFGYQALRGLNLLLGKHDEALSFARKAVDLAPNDQLANGALAVTQMFRDELVPAIETFERVMRFGPTVNRMFQRSFGLALLCADHTDRAILILERLAHQEPEWPEGLAQLAATYASVGRLGEASSTVGKILSCDPTYTASRYTGLLQFKNSERNE
jgi:adenylate cyclase